MVVFEDEKTGEAVLYFTSRGFPDAPFEHAVLVVGPFVAGFQGLLLSSLQVPDPDSFRGTLRVIGRKGNALAGGVIGDPEDSPVAASSTPAWTAWELSAIFS